MTRRNMVKSYLIDGKSLSFNPQYRGTALRVISRFGESRLSYCKCSLVIRQWLIMCVECTMQKLSGGCLQGCHSFTT